MHTPRQLLRSLTAATTTAALLLLGAPAVLGGADHVGPAESRGYDVPSSAGPLALASHHKPHKNRKIKRYRVHRGDTPSEIAVRYHAWTDELIRMNHGPRLYAGEVIRIPVVVKAARACDQHKHHRTGFRDGRDRADRGDRPKKPAKASKNKAKNKGSDKESKKDKKDKAGKKPRGWRHADASRAKVRQVIIRKANKIGVDPHLALAVAWMESGWQQRRVSSAGALGVMQVMPGTGRWLGQVFDREFNLRNLYGNVTAGVSLLELLRDQARPKIAVAGYFQGLAGVRRHGMYKSTEHYVSAVFALKDRLENGWNPA